MTMYLFADCEDEWPKEGLLIKVRVHGRRIFSMHIPTLLENAGGIKAPYASDDILGAAIADEIKRVKEKDKDSMEDNYDLLLVGEKIDTNGIIRGTASNWSLSQISGGRYRRVDFPRLCSSLLVPRRRSRLLGASLPPEAGLPGRLTVSFELRVCA